MAQITYFNVPSADITEKGKVVAQLQVNFEDFYRTAATFDYGLGRKWEIGANVYHLEYEPGGRRFVRNDSTFEQPYSPLFLINAQKGLDISETLEVTIGIQTGFNPAPENHSSWAGYAYTNLAGKTKDEHYEWSLGAYTGNSHYLGEGPKVGLQTGFDAGIFYQKVHLLGEWVSGTHAMGQLVLGAEVYLAKRLPLSIGWQRANKDGAQALIVQITLLSE
ncbi:hypothetical protein [Fibrisoma limi]|uniref:hypothetical protein n=1 Tax=Fibrisoma limi TaxID=663275 RepID=UPI0002E0ACDF|nr:hypothetical protein [Fibrisoma limi]